MEFYISAVIENLPRKFKFYENLTRTANTFHTNPCTFMITFSLLLLRMRNVSDRIYIENRDTHFKFSSFFS